MQQEDGILVYGHAEEKCLFLAMPSLYMVMLEEML